MEAEPLDPLAQRRDVGRNLSVRRAVRPVPISFHFAAGPLSYKAGRGDYDAGRTERLFALWGATNRANGHSQGLLLSPPSLVARPPGERHLSLDV